MRLMGLDLGDVRIGIALSDMLGIIATGKETYTRKDLAYDLNYLGKLIKDNNVSTVVVGLPINMDGSSGNRVEKTYEFCNELKKYTEAKIVYQDERLTSVAAEKMLISSNMRREKRKQVIDKVAATLILQTYLDTGKK